MKTGDRYQHFKGAIYTVLCIATNADTALEMVVYQGEDYHIWTRPLDYFNGMVETMEGETVPRFKPLEFDAAEFQAPNGWQNPFLAAWTNHLLQDNARMIAENNRLRVALGSVTDVKRKDQTR